MAPLTWGKQVERTLINLVREQPPLWNTLDPSYTKKKLKRDLYQQIADMMKALYPEIQNITPDNVHAKYSNLRSSFKRELKKIQAVKSRSAGKIEPTDSQWPLFESMLFLSDVDPGPSCTTATFDSHVPAASIEMCSPEECSLEEDDNLFPTTENSTLDIGSSSENVICIKAETGTSDCEDTPSRSTPSPTCVSSPTPPPVLGPSTQPLPSLAPGPKRTPSRKRKRKSSGEPASSGTHRILGAMIDAISDMNRPKSFPSSCGLIVEKACEKLPLIKQVRLLTKICKLLEEEFLELGVSQ